MFGIFKNKTDAEKKIQSIGIESYAYEVANTISGMLKTNSLIYQFVLEELDAASQGNSASKSFVLKSGISKDKYTGAMNRSSKEIDGPGGPQQYLLSICFQLKSDMETLVNFRLKVLDNLMKKFSLGKYATEPESKYQYVHFDSSVDMLVFYVLNEGGKIGKEEAKILVSNSLKIFKGDINKIRPLVIVLLSFANILYTGYSTKNQSVILFYSACFKKVIGEIQSKPSDCYNDEEFNVIDHCVKSVMNFSNM